MRPSPRLLLLAALAFAVYTPDAQAYIDPTAAGSALQSLYILMVTAMMGLAMMPKKVAGFYSALKQKFRPGKPSLPAPDQKDV